MKSLLSRTLPACGAALTLGVLLAGCGLKGPLYLPVKPSVPAAADDEPASPPAAPASSSR